MQKCITWLTILNSMYLVISKEDLLMQLIKQLENFFILSEKDKKCISACLEEVLIRCEHNFINANNKYYQYTENEVKFDPCHSVQYMIFLYYLSHYLYKNNIGEGLCDKVYYLNKIMNGVDLFYAIKLPNAFSAEHPIGTIMGRAEYSDGFFFYQGCTVGGTRKGKQLYYPLIGKNVKMYANSSIIGNCIIGDNVQIGAGCIVKNQNIPSNATVFGQSPNLIIKKYDTI